jgi:glycerol-3-phosphate acyltransferase PlsX
MKIALDVMGGDFAPQNPIGGVKLALESLPAITKLFLVGVPEVIEKELQAQRRLQPETGNRPRQSQVVEMSTAASTPSARRRTAPSAARSIWSKTARRKPPSAPVTPGPR